eukprot:2050595-Pyramimonas_sp.AAC.2
MGASDAFLGQILGTSRVSSRLFLGFPEDFPGAFPTLPRACLGRSGAFCALPRGLHRAFSVSSGAWG